MDKLPRLISFKMAAQYLNMKESTLYKVPVELLPKQKVGGLLNYRESDIMKYLENNYQRS